MGVYDDGAKQDRKRSFPQRTASSIGAIDILDLTLPYSFHEIINTALILWRD